MVFNQLGVLYPLYTSVYQSPSNSKLVKCVSKNTNSIMAFAMHQMEFYTNNRVRAFKQLILYPRDQTYWNGVWKFKGVCGMPLDFIEASKSIMIYFLTRKFNIMHTRLSFGQVSPVESRYALFLLNWNCAPLNRGLQPWTIQMLVNLRPSLKITRTRTGEPP